VIIFLHIRVNLVRQKKGFIVEVNFYVHNQLNKINFAA
jgi:hypothetical protein